MASRILVVIPTYNEREALPGLVQAITDLKISNLGILIVDDNSPDGTGVIADELSKTLPLRVIHRPLKSGLGNAYRDAYRLLIRSQEVPDLLIQMDADGSHDSSVIPLLLQEILDADLVLGSRYITGGEIQRWGFFREFISRSGNWYARTVLGLKERDVTGGYRCFRGKVISAIDWGIIHSMGYNFQIEVLYQAAKSGFKIKEIPITFTERKSGSSKFNLKIIWESFWRILYVRFSQGRIV